MTALAGVFHEPLGVDFSAAFAAGLRERLSDPRPEAVARVTLLVNTNRMGRRIQAAFAEQGATLLPKVRMVSDIVGLLPPGALPPTTHRPLADRLALSQLVRALLERAPTLSPPSAAFDMAGTLMALMTEMQEEAVPPEALAALDLGDMAAHWQTSWQFLQIAMAFAAEAGLAPVAARQEAALALLADRWTTDPPKDPVLIAGSTASRGQTQRLMKLVLTLPQGGVVLPGMDTTMPAAAWTDLTAGEGNLSAPQDHPQYRHAAFLRALGLDRDQCQKWSGTAPRVPERTALLSLALRPAPATNAWQEEGPKLKGVGTACARVTLLHAPTPSTEAAAIALGLRAALDDNKRAALISPDRTLTRQVAAYLGRWNILPDDSAGVPLVQSSPGRFLMLSGQMLGRPVEAEALTILLNHPLCHGAGGRRKHLDRARAMELTLLRKGPCPFPDPQRVTEWANRAGIDPTWVSWLTDALGQMAASTATGPLVQFVSAHQALVAQLSTGSAAAERDPWSAPGGAAALGVLASLVDAAPALGDTPISVGEYTRILHAVLAAEELREPHAPHPDIMIWGALEARARSADLVILGGLNDGIWPAQPEPDPWLNRAMRAQVGLRLPDRVIGLSAHDFQQAASAPEVWLTRAARNAEAETVPSRWLNRLERLLTGLGAAGETAHASMLARGKTWLTQAQALTEPQAKHVQPAAPRPGPKPPATALPATLSVTQIETLIRDPYAIYAQKILQLQSLAPLRQGPDGRVRGSTLHTAMERFTEATGEGLGPTAAATLRQSFADALEQNAPWPAMQRLWLGKFDRILDDLLAAETARRARGQPLRIEEKGRWPMAGLDLTVTARADRLDREGGQIAIYDYKTSIPSEKKQKAFAKQLLFEAVMLTHGAFTGLGHQPVSHVTYLQIGSSYKESQIAITPDILRDTEDGLRALWGAYRAGRPFLARLAPDLITYSGDFDHLSRLGEWGEADAATPQTVGLS